MKPPRLNPKATDKQIKDALRAYAENSIDPEDNTSFIIDQLKTVRGNEDDVEMLFRSTMRGLVSKEVIDWYVHEYIRS